MNKVYLYSIAAAVAVCSLPLTGYSAEAASAKVAAESKPRTPKNAKASEKVVVIPADQVNTKRVLLAMCENKVKASLGEDGAVEVQIGDNVYWIYVEKESKYLKFCWNLGLRDCPLDKAKALCHKYNVNKVFLRFRMGEKNKNVVVTDYYMTYAGGLIEKNLLDSLDWIRTVAEEFRVDLAKSIQGEE